MSERFCCLTSDCINWAANQDDYCLHGRPVFQDGRCTNYISKDTVNYMYPLDKSKLCKKN